MNLELHVDRPPPASLPAGSADAFFCAGACGDAAGQLEIVIGGEQRHRAWASGMPPGGLFWAIVPVRAPASEGSLTVEIELRTGGRAQIGTIEIRPPVTAPVTTARPASPNGDLIAVCMATFEPDPALLSAQVESLRAQTDERWICLISDDGSSEELLGRLTELIRGDSRFELSRAPERRGFYRNFERALQMVPSDAGFVALCDQDDRWHPDKLATLRTAIGDTGLVYSDMRLVDAGGTVLRDTLWRGRRNNHEDLTSMLVANSITGAASLFRRELLEVALPFPDTPGFQFHDAWLAVAALATGEVAYVDRPLYDYVQHPGAVFGDVTHGPRVRFHRPDALRPVTWRAAYFHGYLSRAAQATVLLTRCPEKITPPKRRALERFVACDHSAAALARLAARPLRELAGHNETLGSELGLARGAAWKHAACAAARHQALARGPLADATIPGPEHFTQRRLRRWRSRV